MLRTFDNNQDDQISRPVVVLVGPRDMKDQRCARLVDQKIELAAMFRSVGRVLTCVCHTQSQWTALNVNRLPLPFDMSFLIIEGRHTSHDLGKNACLLPGLKAFMQHTA